MNADQYTFFGGNVGMMFNGSWFIQMLLDQTDEYDFKWGAIPMPHWKNGPVKSYATVTNVAINAKSTKINEAWELVKFLTGPEGAKIMAEQKMMPGLIDTGVIEAFSSAPGFPPDSVDSLSADKLFLTTPSSQVGSDIQKIILEEAELYLTKNQDLNNTIANMIERRKKEVLDKK
jgi:multiple sugar transport system substrate-binding protein